jgi:hypothetical protein
MLPRDLEPESFFRYPPHARDFAVAHLRVLRQVPLALLPILLKEIIGYDWLFPVEQRTFVRQYDYLETLSAATFASWVAPFAAVTIPTEVGAVDWINQPQVFSERLSAYLWSSQQITQYRAAADQYQSKLRAAVPDEPLPVPRFTIAVVGQGVAQTSFVPFRKLRPYGSIFTSVSPNGGIQSLLSFLQQRAKDHPLSYAHWYIEGGALDASYNAREGIAATSYTALGRVAAKELSLTQQFLERPNRKGTINAESVQSFMAALTPADLGLNDGAEDAALRNFELKVLTQGAGTQVFSTTFVQWAAREALRRAQPVTMLARFAPRQRNAPMNDLLRRDPMAQAKDPEGSLVDADMGAYYTWINQSRLPGANEARFLAWFEDHHLAVAIGPMLPRGTTSDLPTSLPKILEWMS